MAERGIASPTQQGDIFRVDVVAPAADEVQRIFRARDGRHGSVVFEENCDGRVFDRTELDALLGASTKTNLHTQPFQRTPEGQEEMVVVFSRLFRFFVIATETCDISGKEKAQHVWATILPVITLADLCKTEQLPFSSTADLLTIHEFLLRHFPENKNLASKGDMDYAPFVRDALKSCIQSAGIKKVRKDLSQVKNYLSSYHKKLYMYPLRASSEFELPESYVDFTSAFTVHTAKLLAIRRLRFVTIADPYRIDFAQKFGQFFARVALPEPMKPD